MCLGAEEDALKLSESRIRMKNILACIIGFCHFSSNVGRMGLKGNFDCDFPPVYDCGCVVLA